MHGKLSWGFWTLSKRNDYSLRVRVCTQPALMDVRQKALFVVERACQTDASDDKYFSVVSLAVSALDMFVKIEYVLVGEVLGRMLAAIVRVSLFIPWSLQFSESSINRFISTVFAFNFLEGKGCGTKLTFRPARIPYKDRTALHTDG